MAAGCDDYDTKPVDLARLLGKIEALLSKAGTRVSTGEDRAGVPGRPGAEGAARACPARAADAVERHHRLQRDAARGRRARGTGRHSRRTARAARCRHRPSRARQRTRGRLPHPAVGEPDRGGGPRRHRAVRPRARGCGPGGRARSTGRRHGAARAVPRRHRPDPRRRSRAARPGPAHLERGLAGRGAHAGSRAVGERPDRNACSASITAPAA